MGFLLYLLSIFLGIFAIPTGLCVVFFKSIYHKHFYAALINVNKKFYLLAKANDEYCNLVFPELFNAILLTKNSRHPCGKDGETISQVVAANLKNQTLTGFGRFLARILIAAKDTAFITS